MSYPRSSRRAAHPRQSASLLVSLLALLLIVEPIFVTSVSAQRRARQSANGPQKGEPLGDDQRVAQVLARLTFGARPGDFELVKSMGVDAYLERQLDPDSIDDSALDVRLGKLPTLALATPVIIEQYTPPPPKPSPSPSPSPAVKPATPAVATDQKAPAAPSAAGAVPAATAAPNAQPQKPAGAEAAKPAAAPAKPPAPARNPQMVVTELQRAAFLRAVYSERQLDEMMVSFWENHFSIFANKDSDRYLLTSFDRDVIRPFAMGRFRDLLGATAHSPAMLYYLDNWQSSVLRQYPAANGKPARKTGGINENYARELMELHTLGVDGGYTQKDVQEVARCLTGWTIRKPNQEGLFVFNPAQHDTGEKLVLGHRIPAGGGITDGERVLDILAAHPSTARFIATKLARRFIGDDPPASAIDRAAQVFLKTGGSIRETLRAIVTSPEFFSRSSYRAKVRSPFEYAAAAVRAVGAETDGDRPMLDWISRMGQPVFGRLTPDGYADRADQWLSTGALLERFNFANALVTNRIKGTRVDVTRLFAGLDLNDARAVEDRLARVALNGDVTKRTRDALDKVATAETAQNPAPANALAPATLTKPTALSYQGNAPAQKTPPSQPPYVAQLMTLVIGSPEFQRR